MALLMGTDHAFGDILDPIQIGHRGAAVFLNDQSHRIPPIVGCHRAARIDLAVAAAVPGDYP
jgi:hypothetical protein